MVVVQQVASRRRLSKCTTYWFVNTPRQALVEPIRKAAAEIMLIVRQQPTGAPATAPLAQPAPSR